MVKVVIKAFATIREALGETGRISIELPVDSNIQSLLKTLSQLFGERFTSEVLDDNGLLKKTVKIFVNGRDIDFLDGLSTPIKDGDEIALIPPVAGG
ncbi:MAG: ubiquitin-like small modifier protein 1 [Candidatus Caldarchaeales archaeon]